MDIKKIEPGVNVVEANPNTVFEHPWATLSWCIIDGYQMCGSSVVNDKLKEMRSALNDIAIVPQDVFAILGITTWERLNKLLSSWAWYVRTKEPPFYFKTQEPLNFVMSWWIVGTVSPKKKIPHVTFGHISHTGKYYTSEGKWFQIVGSGWGSLGNYAFHDNWTHSPLGWYNYMRSHGASSNDDIYKWFMWLHNEHSEFRANFGKTSFTYKGVTYRVNFGNDNWLMVCPDLDSSDDAAISASRTHLRDELKLTSQR